MSAAEKSPPVDLRVPIGWRVYLGLFGVVWISLCVLFGVQALHTRPGYAAVVAAVMLFGLALCVRTLRARAYGEGDVLVVRNVLSTRRLPRASLRGVRVGRPNGNPGRLGQVVSVVDERGTVVTIDASVRTTFTAAGERALTEQRDALEAWRRGPRSRGRLRGR